MDSLVEIVRRLEVAVQRLETTNSSSASVSSGQASNAPSAPSSTSNSSSSSVAAFDAFLAAHLTPFMTLSAAISPIVADQANIVKIAFDQTKALISAASAHKKPTPAVFQTLITPLSKSLQTAVQLRDVNRSVAEVFTVMSVVAEGVPALGWVAVEPAPGPYINDMKDASTFYLNRVLKEFKDKSKTHVEWCASWTTLLTELSAHVKKFHTTGLSWNPKGGELDASKISLAHTSVSAAAAAAPAVKPAAAANPGPKALLSELTKGGSVTSSLKKVDTSQMTHKNPELRASSVVPASSTSTSTSATSAPTAAVSAIKPPKFELDGSKWVIENQVKAQLEIPSPDLRHVVYVYNCRDTVIKVLGKVNAITLDKCQKVGLVVPSIVSTLDVVNSKSIQLQSTGPGRVPTITIDKTDGVQVFLNKESMDIEILSAKSSEINVSFQTDDGEWVEKAVGEQILSRVVCGKVVSSVVEHKG